MLFIPENKLAGQIKEILRDAQEVRVAVAFWGQGAVKNLGLPDVACPLRIVCNLDTGGTNPGEARRLLDIPRAAVRTNPRLHAKVWWTDKAVILGSANASANGLSFEGAELSGWIEANVLSTDKALIKAVGRWFDNEVWDAGSRPIKNRDLQQATDLWKLRRRQRPHVGRGQSLLDELLTNPDAFRDRGDLIAVYGPGRMSEKEEELHAEAKEQRHDSKLDAYAGWQDVAVPGACVVDFRSYQNKRLPSLRGIFRFLNDDPIFSGEGNSIALCHKVRDVRGFGLPKDDHPRWADLISRLNWDNEWRRPLYDFAREVVLVKKRTRL
ncbi:phospholipase D family protein [Azospirillum soli]|uniref:phospholipase D family protein n=1 Tax=Azospirillum soli TaxID=1304799 RepID=UPI001AE958A5|nr:phospholipase D family protein [Azospirillum soli]MBP2315476.1 hypothetical protein [Azospirillum soli]